MWWVPRLLFLGSAIFLVVESARGVSSAELRVALIAFGACSAVFVARQLLIGPQGARWLLPAGLGLVGAGVVVLIVYQFGTRLDALPLVGAALILLGIGWLVEAWRTAAREAPNGEHLLGAGLGLLLAAIILVAIAGGMFMNGVKGSLYVAVFVMLGVALVALLPLSTNLLSERCLRWLCLGNGVAKNASAARFAPVGGLTVVALAAVFIGWLFWRDWTLTAIVVGTVALLVLATVSKTHADVALLLAGITLLAAAPPEQPMPDALTPGAGQNVLVALGDSYMSGEGASTYFRGTDDAGEHECRRAPSAYAARMAGEGGRFDHVTFLACSGARTFNVIATSDDPAATPQRGEPGTQLDQLKALGGTFRPALVIVSLGGNDAGFASIGETCLAPGDCDSERSLFEGTLPSVERALIATYTSIRNALPGVPIVAVPYPQPVADAARCNGVALAKSERDFIRSFLDKLDARIERAARKTGIHYLADMKDALAKRHLQLCDKRKSVAGVNFLDLKSVHGLPAQRYSPFNWLHNSLHPNEIGHTAMFETLRSWLDANDQVLAQGQAPTVGAADLTPPSPPEGAVTEPEPPCSMTASGDANCKTLARTWALGRVVNLWPWSLLVLLALLLLWAAGIGLVSALPVERRR